MPIGEDAMTPREKVAEVSEALDGVRRALFDLRREMVRARMQPPLEIVLNHDRDAAFIRHCSKYDERKFDRPSTGESTYLATICGIDFVYEPRRK